MDRLLTLDPPDLTLRFEVGRKSVAVIRLTNVTETMTVAFKVHTDAAPKKFSFKPPHGIIPPLGKATFEITMNAQNVLPDSFPLCNETFMVKSLVAPAGHGSESFVSVDWFTGKKNFKAVINETRFRVFFVGGGILRDLVTKGCTDKTRQLLDLDSSIVDATDDNGCTAMHMAVSMRSPELVQVLLEYKPNLEMRNSAGQTPLHLAARSGEALITEILLLGGAKTEATSESGWRSLHYATVKGHCEVMRLLIKGHADIDAPLRDGRTAINIAVAEGHKHCVNLLLKKGCNVDSRNAEGVTALHIASARGHVALVKLLLDHGANTDVRNSKGKTPYDDAADSGQTLLFDMLRLGDELRNAARKGDLELVKKCLKQGAVVDGEDQYGWTALQRAAFKGRLHIVKFLIEECSADVNHRDKDGYTALHAAAETGHKEVVIFLVEKGIHVNDKTNKGQTPVQIARAMNYGEIVEILVQGGARSSKDANPFEEKPEKWRSDRPHAELEKTDDLKEELEDWGEKFLLRGKSNSIMSPSLRCKDVAIYPASGRLGRLSLDPNSFNHNRFAAYV